VSRDQTDTARIKINVRRHIARFPILHEHGWWTVYIRNTNPDFITQLHVQQQQQQQQRRRRRRRQQQYFIRHRAE